MKRFDRGGRASLASLPNDYHELVMFAATAGQSGVLCVLANFRALPIAGG